jgi:hypothetical protein
MPAHITMFGKNRQVCVSQAVYLRKNDGKYACFSLKSIYENTSKKKSVMVIGLKILSLRGSR